MIHSCKKVLLKSGQLNELKTLKKNRSKKYVLGNKQSTIKHYIAKILGYPKGDIEESARRFSMAQKRKCGKNQQETLAYYVGSASRASQRMIRRYITEYQGS